MSDSPTEPAAPDLHWSSSRDRLVAISHGAVVVIASAIGLLDLLASGFFAPYLAGAIGFPLVLLGIGFIRHGRGRREGRVFIAVADVAVLAMVAIALALASDPNFSVVWRIVPLVLGGVTVLALATVPLATSWPHATPVHRSPWHRIGVLPLLAAGIVPAIATFASRAGEFPLAVALSSTVPSVISATVLAVAWWFGSRWLLGLASIGRLAYAASLAMIARPAAGIQLALVGGLGLLIAARGPRLVEAAVEWRRQATEGEPISRAAVTWAVVGAILLVPGVLGGLYLRRLFCSDCGTSPQIVPPIVDVGLTVVVLALAVILGVRARGHGPKGGTVAWLGFAGSILLLGQAMLGVVGVWGLDGMSVAGPAATLAAVGFAATIRAPAWLQGVGSWSALAWALIAMIWMNQAGIALPPYFNIWFARLSILATGAFILVALAREATTGPPDVLEAVGAQVDEVPEPVETESLHATIRRR